MTQIIAVGVYDILKSVQLEFYEIVFTSLGALPVAVFFYANI